MLFGCNQEKKIDRLPEINYDEFPSHATRLLIQEADERNAICCIPHFSTPFCLLSSNDTSRIEYYASLSVGQ